MLAVLPLVVALAASPRAVTAPTAAPAPRTVGVPAATPFGRLLARHAASAMLKQLALDDLVGGTPRWAVDLEAGTIRFGDGPPHPVQLLGSEARRDGTWLWAWANTVSDLPPAMVLASERLRRIGTERRIPQLSERKHPVVEADGHQLAAVAVGLLGGAGSFSAPYGNGEGGGAAFFLLTDFPTAGQVNRGAMRLIRAVEMAISAWPLDHREVVRGLAADLGLVLAEAPRRLTLSVPQGRPVVFDFDEMGRLVKLSGTVGP